MKFGPFFALALSLSAQTLDTSAWTAADDHRNMMEQLGIKALRPGPSGNEAAPNHANYDEAKANPFPDLPDAAHAQERPEGRPRPHVVESAPPGNRRGLRARSLRPRAEERPEGHLDVTKHGRRTESSATRP